MNENIQYLARHMDSVVEKALRVFDAVEIAGPTWRGKPARHYIIQKVAFAYQK